MTNSVMCDKAIHTLLEMLPLRVNKARDYERN